MENSPAVIKLVLVGESGVGKTSLIRQFVRNEFNEHIASSLGGSFCSKKLEIQESKLSVRFDIWDTAGQEKYHSLAAMHFKDAAAALLVYDMTKIESFNKLQYWLGELKANAPPNIKIVIAANKSDLVGLEQVSLDMANKFADDNQTSCHPTSAKDATGVRELFVKIADLVLGPSIPNSTSDPKDPFQHEKLKSTPSTPVPGQDRQTQKLIAFTPTEPGKKTKKCC